MLENNCTVFVISGEKHRVHSSKQPSTVVLIQIYHLHHISKFSKCLELILEWFTILLLNYIVSDTLYRCFFSKDSYARCVLGKTERSLYIKRLSTINCKLVSIDDWNNHIIACDFSNIILWKREKINTLILFL